MRVEDKHRYLDVCVFVCVRIFAIVSISPPVRDSSGEGRQRGQCGGSPTRRRAHIPGEEYRRVGGFPLGPSWPGALSIKRSSN